MTLRKQVALLATGLYQWALFDHHTSYLFAVLLFALG